MIADAIVTAARDHLVQLGYPPDFLTRQEIEGAYREVRADWTEPTALEPQHGPFAAAVLTAAERRHRT